MKSSVGVFALVLVFAAGCQSSRFFAALNGKQKPRYNEDEFWPDDKRPSRRRNDRSRREPDRDARIARLIKRAKADFARKDLRTAKRGFEDALALDPDNATAHHQLAMIADLQRDFTSADRHYRAALAKDPRDPHLLCNLGYSYLLQKRYSESEKTLRDALRIDPKHKKTLYNLGALYGEQGQSRLAYEHFRRAGASKREAEGLLAELRARKGTSDVRLAGGVDARRDDERYSAPDPGSRRQPSLRDPDELRRRMAEARHHGEADRRERSDRRDEPLGRRQPGRDDRTASYDGRTDERRNDTARPGRYELITPGDGDRSDGRRQEISIRPRYRNDDRNRVSGDLTRDARDSRYGDARYPNTPQRPRTDYQPARETDNRTMTPRDDSMRRDPLLFPPPNDNRRDGMPRGDENPRPPAGDGRYSQDRGNSTAHLPAARSHQITEDDRRALRMAQGVGGAMFPGSTGAVRNAGGEDSRRSNESRNAVYYGDRNRGARSADYSDADRRRETARVRDNGRYIHFGPSRTDSRDVNRRDETDDRRGYSSRGDDSDRRDLPDRNGYSNPMIVPRR